MKAHFLLIASFFALFAGVPRLAWAQEKVTLSGNLTDGTNGEALIGATVYIQENESGTVANTYGFYSITLEPGTYTVKYSYVGFAPKVDTLQLESDLRKDVELMPATQQTEEVLVEAEKEDKMKNVESLQMSVSEMDMKTIKKIPALLGEVDVIRSIKMMPGVTGVGEGSSGFNVRGGSVDHNLVLLDDAPVYNTSHLFGFFSVFNPDAVRDVKLYKGGIPAQYGGRLASVLDVRMKEGNNKEFAGSGGIGTIFSRGAIEGPIVEDKGSFIVAGRRSYIDALLSPFDIGGIDFSENQLYFYDLTAKANYKFNKQNQLFLSGYLGRDVFGFADIFGFDWGNRTLTLRWNNITADDLFFNLTAYASNYDYSLEARGGSNAFRWTSNIINYAARPEFTWFATPKQTWTFGAQTILYQFKPGNARPTSEQSIFNQTKLPDRWALEGAAYLQNEHKITEKFGMQYGLRTSFFDYYGSGKVYHFRDTTPGIRKPVERIEQNEDLQSIARYLNPEPRISARYKLNPQSSVKASYMRTAQYIHLLSNTASITPFDVWHPSDNNIRPQRADQLALGYFRNMGPNGNDYEFSAEAYYKDMQNQIDYINGADLLLNDSLAGELLIGEGRAYGLELQLKKNLGDLTGFISYTLSRTERKVPGINNHQWYPTRYDQTHNLKVFATYDLNWKWAFSSTFTYITGTPTTLPSGRFEYEGIVVPHSANNARHNTRIPDYLRWDLGITMKTKGFDVFDHHVEGEWVFSAYNVLSRRNPFSIRMEQQTNRFEAGIPRKGQPGFGVDPFKAEAIRFSVFGSAIFAATYNFKF